MHSRLRLLRSLVFVFLSWAISASAPASAYPIDFGPGFTTRTVNVDGAVVNMTIGGHGPAVVLLHGYGEDSRMWKPLAIVLAPRFTVIAPDLPGRSASATR
jgi:pimeloyl-ACP methyl ester carboxylesterase